MNDDIKLASKDDFEAHITCPSSTNLDVHPSNHHHYPSQPGTLANLDLELTKLDTGKKMTDDPVTKDMTKHRVLRGWVILNEGISVRNFYFSWLYVVYLGFVLISFSTLEPQYINITFNVPLEEMGKTTAVLYLIDYSVRLCFAMVFGPMIDYYGRKFVLTLAIILVSVGYFLIPFFSFSLFPGYLIGKSILSCGMIALSMLPFSADYIDDSTKGVMTGMNYGVGFIGGALAGIFIKTVLTLQLPYKTIYMMHGPILLISGFLIRTGIKGGNTYYKIKTVDGEPEIQSKGQQWEKIKKAFKEIPWVSISIIFGVLGNTDFYIMTTGLMIWLKSFLPENEDPTILATTYQVIFFGLSVITTAVSALKIDKIPHMRMIFPVLIIATIGFAFIPFAPSPKNALVYMFFCIEGVSLPGVFVFSTYLAIRYNPPEIRGTLSGIGNGVGFLGAIIILSLGGFLHDHWRSDASFILYGGLLFATLVIVTWIYVRTMAYTVKPNDVEMKKLAVVESLDAL